MVFVRYHDTNGYVEQFLFCRPLTKNTTGKEIFKWICSLKGINLNGLTVFLFALMALPFIMGSKIGFMSFVKRQNNDISVIHYLFYRENLAAKELQEDLSIVFKEVVTVVNYIDLVPYTLVYFVSCVTKYVHNTLSF